MENRKDKIAVDRIVFGAENWFLRQVNNLKKNYPAETMLLDNRNAGSDNHGG